MAAFITLQYRELAGQFTINVDKITKYERQSNSCTTVYLDNGTQELVKEAPEQIDVLIGTAQTPGRAV
jgi:NAD/NADP transhydrogenase alpha subunit